MKKITQFAVNYPVTIFMIVIAVILLGVISLSKLGMDLFPDLNNPRLFVELKAGERPPDEIEKNFTDNLEALSIRQSDVVQVSSITKVGAAQITVEYAWDKDMDEAFLELQKALSSVSQNWDIDELNISQYDPNSTPVMIIAFDNPSIDDMSSLKKTAENYIRNELIRLEGVADIEISGAEEKEVRIKTTPYILEAHDLTLDDIVSKIEQFNRNVSGGSVLEMGKQYVIKGISLYQNINDFKNTIIKYEQTTDGDSVYYAPVYLSNVADVEYINKDPENIVHINGKRCLGLSIYKETKYNTVDAVADLQKALETITKALPGYEFFVVQNQGKFIQSAIGEVTDSAILGIILAVIIIFIFLRRIGTTFIISLAIPISIFATFNLMYFNDLTLNIMTLGGLALGAGMLVDNAIVVMENIFRNIESGLSLRDAAIEGTAQVGGAITASTITTIIVFLPIVYLQGASGELFKDQAWTVAFSLVSSLFVALLLIPVATSKFLKPKAKKSNSLTFSGYSNFLSKILDKKWSIVTAAVILVVVGIFLVPVVGSEFMPKADSNEITVELKLPEGTELERTAQTISSLENIIETTIGDKINVLYSQAGPSTGLTTTEQNFYEDKNTGKIKIILKDDQVKYSSQIQKQIGAILETSQDIEYKFVQNETPLAQILGTEEVPIIIEIQGEDLDQIEKLTKVVLDKAQQLNVLSNVESTFEEGTPVLEVKVDKLRAGIYNVSVEQITSQLQDKLQGKSAGEWDYEGDMNDITLKLPDYTIKELGDIIIRSNNQNFRLAEIADIVETTSPKEIYRENQTRIGKVTAQINGDLSFDKVVAQIREMLNGIDFPDEYKAVITGEEQLREESMSSLTFALILSIILVYMALASQFESLIHPFTILLTIPLAGVGAILIFFVLGMTLNIMAYIGIIMLAGISVNDSIILVDAINQLRREGLGRKEAIMAAGSRRIRPIIMTSLTTILALLPLTLGFGESASLRSPMAIAVIGGLITSTILTLIVIPCVYYLLDQVKEKLNFLNRPGGQIS